MTGLRGLSWGSNPGHEVSDQNRVFQPHTSFSLSRVFRPRAISPSTLRVCTRCHQPAGRCLPVAGPSGSRPHRRGIALGRTPPSRRLPSTLHGTRWQPGTRRRTSGFGPPCRRALWEEEDPFPQRLGLASDIPSEPQIPECNAPKRHPIPSEQSQLEVPGAEGIHFRRQAAGPW